MFYCPEDNKDSEATYADGAQADDWIYGDEARQRCPRPREASSTPKLRGAYVALKALPAGGQVGREPRRSSLVR